MSGLLLRSRLEALGVDIASLPPLQDCPCCKGESGLVEMSFSVMADRWTVWCGCGLGTNEHATLLAAIREWNTLQWGHPDEDEVPLGVEAAMPGVH